MEFSDAVSFFDWVLKERTFSIQAMSSRSGRGGHGNSSGSLLSAGGGWIRGGVMRPSVTAIGGSG